MAFRTIYGMNHLHFSSYSYLLRCELPLQATSNLLCCNSKNQIPDENQTMPIFFSAKKRVLEFSISDYIRSKTKKWDLEGQIKKKKSITYIISDAKHGWFMNRNYLEIVTLPS